MQQLVWYSMLEMKFSQIAWQRKRERLDAQNTSILLLQATSIESIEQYNASNLINHVKLRGNSIYLMDHRNLLSFKTNCLPLNFNIKHYDWITSKCVSNDIFNSLWITLENINPIWPWPKICQYRHMTPTIRSFHHNKTDECVTWCAS